MHCILWFIFVLFFRKLGLKFVDKVYHNIICTRLRQPQQDSFKNNNNYSGEIAMYIFDSYQKDLERE